jgi:hypothetical protein
MFLPIACIALFFIGGFLGLLIGTVTWAILRLRPKSDAS